MRLPGTNDPAPRADGGERRSPPLEVQLYTDTLSVCLPTLSPCQGSRLQENQSDNRACCPYARARWPFRAAALPDPAHIATIPPSPLLMILPSSLLAEGAGLERCGAGKLHEHDAPAQRDQAGDEHADGGKAQHVPSR